MLTVEVKYRAFVAETTRLEVELRASEKKMEHLQHTIESQDKWRENQIKVATETGETVIIVTFYSTLTGKK